MSLFRLIQRIFDRNGYNLWLEKKVNYENQKVYDTRTGYKTTLIAKEYSLRYALSQEEIDTKEAMERAYDYHLLFRGIN